MSNHLKPCPFCGGDASFNDHTDGCYFTVLRKLKADPPADLSRVPDLIEAWNTRTAIQQAESEPVGEPRARVELIKTGGNAGLSTRIIELDIATRERLRPGDLLYTHPAPGMPDDVVRDAARYRWLAAYCRSTTEHWGGRWSIVIEGPAPKTKDSEDDFDAAIDAAMTASPAQKGGE